MARGKTASRRAREEKPREESKPQLWEWRIGEEVFDCQWTNPQEIEGRPFRILKQKRSELNTTRYEDGQAVGKERRPFLLTLADMGAEVKLVFKLDWNDYRADLMRSINMLEECGLNTSGLTWELHKPRNYWAFRCVSDVVGEDLAIAGELARSSSSGPGRDRDEDRDELNDIPF